jgi:protein-disulfide isomerase
VTRSTIAVCAGAVAERFWPMHDRLYATQAEWSTAPDPTPIFARLARESGVPAEPFKACVDRDRVASVIISDLLYSAEARVDGTPAFVINREQSVMGMKSFEEWKMLLDKAIAGKSRN